MTIVKDFRRPPEPTAIGWRDMIRATSGAYISYTVPANSGASEGRIFAKIQPTVSPILVQFVSTVSVPIPIGTVVGGGSGLAGNAPIVVPTEGATFQIPNVTSISIHNPSSSTQFVGIELYSKN